MQITRKMLVEWNACQSGLDWFDNNFSEDGQEYQEILNKLAEQNEAGYAEWLIRKAGVQDIVLEIDELVSENCFFFAGEIKVTGNIQIKFRLVAGKGIEAGCGIEAGDGIKAGWGIEAGWGIKAGYGIEAGDGIKAGYGIEACYGIKAGYGIEAGDDIKAGYGIEAGDGIKAGWGIEAGDGIKAGDKYGIFAGLSIRVNEWSIYANVCANSKPSNLISGNFVLNDNDK